LCFPQELCGGQDRRCWQLFEKAIEFFRNLITQLTPSAPAGEALQLRRDFLDGNSLEMECLLEDDRRREALLAAAERLRGPLATKQGRLVHLQHCCGFGLVWPSRDQRSGPRT